MSPDKPSEQPHYNQVYSQLVKEPNDFVGMIAYAHYKRQKLEAIFRHREETGSAPDDETLRGIHRTLSTPSAMGSYRQAAESLVERFGQSLQDEIIETVNEEVKSQYEERLERIATQNAKSIDEIIEGHKGATKTMVESAVKASRQMFGNKILQSVCASVVIAFLTLLFTLLFFGSFRDFFDAITKKISSPTHESQTKSVTNSSN